MISEYPSGESRRHIRMSEKNKETEAPVAPTMPTPASSSSGISLSPFNCNAKAVAKEWESWKKMLELALKTHKCIEAEEKKNWLLLLGGKDLLEIFETVADPTYAEQDDEFQKAIKKLDSFFLPKKNKIYERHLLRKIFQKEDEFFDRFVLRVKQQANNCDFGNFLLEAIVDQLVEGCRSKELKTKCLSTEMNLTEVMKLGISLETVESQVKILHGNESKESESINKIFEKKPPRNSGPRECYQCGGPWFIGHREKCKATSHRCNICKKIGHLESKCFSRKRAFPAAEVNATNLKKKKTSGCYEVSMDGRFDAVEDEIFYLGGDAEVTCKVGDVPIKMIIDSGASANLIDENSYRMLMAKRLSHQPIPVHDLSKNFVAYASDHPLVVEAAFRASISVVSKKISAIFYVIKNSRKSLLGKQTAMELGVLKIEIPRECNAVQAVTPFPHMKGIKVKLNIDQGVHPVSQQLRRVPIAFEGKIEEKIDELLALQIIEKVKVYLIFIF